MIEVDENGSLAPPPEAGSRIDVINVSCRSSSWPWS